MAVDRKGAGKEGLRGGVVCEGASGGLRVDGVAADRSGSAFDGGVQEEDPIGAGDRVHQLGGELMDGNGAGDALGGAITQAVIAAERVAVSDDQHAILSS